MSQNLPIFGHNHEYRLLFLTNHSNTWRKSYESNFFALNNKFKFSKMPLNSSYKNFSMHAYITIWLRNMGGHV